MIYEVRLKSKKEIAKGTMAFEFEKPQGFQFTAGQFIVVTLDIKETDERGNIRPFSIASVPYEKNIMIAMRMRDSAFKRHLKEMPLGTEVKIDGPKGFFTLPKKNDKPVVFLAGGIGITPVRSMILQAQHDKLSTKVFLFYSNRHKEDSAFLDEISDIKNIKFIPTMTQDDKWAGEHGRVNEEMISKYVKSDALYYVVGPSAFIEAMMEILQKMGIEEDNIKSDEFVGY